MKHSIPDIRALTNQLVAENRRVQERFLNSLSVTVDLLVAAHAEDDWDEIDRQVTQISESATAVHLDEIAQAANSVLEPADASDKIQRTRDLMKLIGTVGRRPQNNG